jgi:hypothetical protein
MNELGLLADLATIYAAVSPNPTVREVEDDKGVTWMQVNVFEIGKSERDKKDIGYRKNIDYYVHLRGTGSEAAYYLGNQPFNTSLKDVTISTSSYQAIANLYNSEVLQQRTLSAVITQCSSVFQETVSSSTSVTIGTGSKSFTVTTGYPAGTVQFNIGIQLLISNNGSNTMTGNVTSYNPSTGALVVNVTSVTGSGTFASWSVVPTNHANRMKMADKANNDLKLVVMEFMCAVALNTTVQAQGTAVADSILLSIVVASWDSYASLIVA